MQMSSHNVNLNVNTNFNQNVSQNTNIRLCLEQAREKNNLVNLPEFIALYQQHHSSSQANHDELEHNAVTLWCKLFNHYGHYRLTKDAAQAIIEYEYHFISGWYFGSYPKHFFPTSALIDGQMLNIIAYDPSSSLNDANECPFALILNHNSNAGTNTTQCTIKAELRPVYDFLEQQRAGKAVFCTSDQLLKAWKKFFSVIDGLNYDKFLEPFLIANTSHLKDCNPITVLGLWYAIMTNAKLPDSDKQRQLDVLSHLPLDQYDSIASMQLSLFPYNYNKPFKFIITEMFDSSGGIRPLTGIDEVRSIDTEYLLWRAVASIPENHKTIPEYKKYFMKVINVLLAFIYYRNYDGDGYLSGMQLVKLLNDNRNGVDVKPPLECWHLLYNSINSALEDQSDYLSTTHKNLVNKAGPLYIFRVVSSANRYSRNDTIANTIPSFVSSYLSRCLAADDSDDEEKLKSSESLKQLLLEYGNKAVYQGAYYYHDSWDRSLCKFDVFYKQKYIEHVFEDPVNSKFSFDNYLSALFVPLPEEQNFWRKLYNSWKNTLTRMQNSPMVLQQLLSHWQEPSNINMDAQRSYREQIQQENILLCSSYLKVQQSLSSAIKAIVLQRLNYVEEYHDAEIHDTEDGLRNLIAQMSHANKALYQALYDNAGSSEEQRVYKGGWSNHPYVKRLHEASTASLREVLKHNSKELIEVAKYRSLTPHLWPREFMMACNPFVAYLSHFNISSEQVASEYVIKPFAELMAVIDKDAPLITVLNKLKIALSLFATLKQHTYEPEDLKNLIALVRDAHVNKWNNQALINAIHQHPRLGQHLQAAHVQDVIKQNCVDDYRSQVYNFSCNMATKDLILDIITLIADLGNDGQIAELVRYTEIILGSHYNYNADMLISLFNIINSELKAAAPENKLLVLADSLLLLKNLQQCPPLLRQDFSVIYNLYQQHQRPNILKRFIAFLQLNKQQPPAANPQVDLDQQPTAANQQADLDQQHQRHNILKRFIAFLQLNKQQPPAANPQVDLDQQQEHSAVNTAAANTDLDAQDSNKVEVLANMVLFGCDCDVSAIKMQLQEYQDLVQDPLLAHNTHVHNALSAGCPVLGPAAMLKLLKQINYYVQSKEQIYSLWRQFAHQPLQLHEFMEALAAMSSNLPEGAKDNIAKLMLMLLANDKITVDALLNLKFNQAGYQTFIDNLGKLALADTQQDCALLYYWPQIKKFCENDQQILSQEAIASFIAGDLKMQRQGYHNKQDEVSAKAQQISHMLGNNLINALDLNFHNEGASLVSRFLDTLNSYKDYSVAKLRAIAGTMRDNGQVAELDHIIQRFALLIELLSRTAANPEIAGSGVTAQELNTTQLALILMIAIFISKQANNSHKMPDIVELITQMNTGEGKSRIIALVSAYYGLCGNTVHQCSKDHMLVERDYLMYRNFLNVLGIKNTYITMDSPTELHRGPGVHYANFDTLCLRLSSSFVKDEPDFLVKEQHAPESKDSHVLILDESDALLTENLYPRNISAIDKKMYELQWVYDYLVEFVADGRAGPAGLDPLVFLAYVRNRNNLNYQLLIEYLRDDVHQQVAIWLKSAQEAVALLHKEGIEYQLTADGVIQVLKNGRIMPGSEFSNGVAQCLTVLLARKYPDRVFNYEPENSLLHSTYPVNVRALYKYVFGFTGTANAETYSPLNPDTVYFIVPPHNASVYYDHGQWLARNQSQQFAYLRECLAQHHKNNIATVILCEDNKQAEAVAKYLRDKKVNHKLLTSQNSSADELLVTSAAGKPGAITVATSGVLGRGTDINATHLMVVHMFIPTRSEYIQGRGRAARNGKPGSFAMIVDKTRYPELNAYKGYFAYGLRRLQSYWDVQHSKDVLAINTKAIATASNLSAILAQFVEPLNPNIPLSAAELQDRADKRTTVLKEFYKIYTGNENSSQDLDDSDLWSNQGKCHALRAEKYHKYNDGQYVVYNKPSVRFWATLCGQRAVGADCRAWLQGRGVLCPGMSKDACTVAVRCMMIALIAAAAIAAITMLLPLVLLPVLLVPWLLPSMIGVGVSMASILVGALLTDVLMKPWYATPPLNLSSNPCL